MQFDDELFLLARKVTTAGNKTTLSFTGKARFSAVHKHFYFALVDAKPLETSLI